MAQKPRKSARERPEAHRKEREAFKVLVLGNPNYFGNIAESPLKPVMPLCCSTFYEELGCVGYHPQQKRLEAVVYVKQPSGYGTGVCGTGTPEYVRFYLSYNDGATWHDQGMTSFQAHNIPEGTQGGKRLEYAVSLDVEPTPGFCFLNPLIRVRAILSWNDPPPADQPDWKPVWGNALEAVILVEPRRFFFLPEFFELAKVQPPPMLKTILDLQTPIQTKAKSLGAPELAELYRKEDVPVHRFAYKELVAFASSAVNESAEAFLALLPDITIGPKIIDLLLPKTDGDTSYEELRCIGLDPNVPDTLVGVMLIKKRLGYSGGPCTDGSKEYVTFWADFDGNGSFETCLGTAEVRVYDLAKIPDEGVCYAVRLPVDLDPYRQSCQAGPKVVRIRAILSWNIPVPCSDPNRVPTWGNREETLIHIAPATGVPAGRIAILGGIPVSHIDPVSGLTDATAVFATNNLPPDSLGRPCPFARRVTAQGAAIPGHSYVVEVSQDGLVWTPALTDLVVTNADGLTSVHKADPGTKRFNYLLFTDNINGVLAEWDSTGDAKWLIRLSVYNGAGVLQGTDTHAIQLDNTGPAASISITTGSGSCGKFLIATALSGNFVARDDYLGRYKLDVDPNVNPVGVGVPSPASGQINTAPAPGDTWTLKTSGMKPCGYVIRVTAVDRAIVNSQSVGHWSSNSAGFCLVSSSEMDE